MLDVLLWLTQVIQGNDFALVVLDLSISPDGLDADTQVHQLAVNPPVVTVIVVQDAHGNKVVLTGAKLAEDDHARAGGVDLRFLFEDLVGAPGVVDPDCWVTGMGG